MGRRIGMIVLAFVVVSGIFGAAASTAGAAGPVLVAGVATPDAKGAWAAWSDGYVSFHGTARFFGGEFGARLNAPITGIATTPTGKGYWLVAADGGIYSFGEAKVTFRPQ